MTIPRPSPAGRRASLLLLVYGASLLLVAAAGLALVLVVGQHLSETAIDSSVAADRSLVRGVVGDIVGTDDVSASVSPEHAAAIQARLAALVDRDGGGIYHIKIWSRDGTILFSDRAGLRGSSFEVEDDLADAFGAAGAAEPAADIVSADDGEAATSQAPPGTRLLEEYLPIERDGRVDAVFEIYRDAGPILAGIDATQHDVVVVTIGAGLVLALLLQLIFRAAQVRLNRQTDELLEATRRDALTGMLNHGSVVGELAALVEARADNGSVGIAVVDIDNFRLVNESYGHESGDRALVAVAETLRHELSQQSILGRFGPDEFLVVAPPECAHDLEPALERLRDRLVDLSLQFGASERLPMTVSAGVAYLPHHAATATSLMSVATAALTEAKASGGNAVRVAETSAADLQARERSSFDVLSGLVIAVDTKDRYTKQHSEDVARYATFLARRVGLDAEQLRTVEIAGLLHDVGKIGIPDVILRKPAALTADEYALVKQHVSLGDSIVRDLPNIGLVRAGVRHHHERWDGTGYLDRLAGTDIPAIARILAVADAFSAMTTSRPYRKAMSVQEALRRLEDAAGSQLDPTFVSAFVSGIETADDVPLPGDGRPPARIWVQQPRVA
ncbi:MAG TPA: diguanylate cyclase [Candidatus Limnocylindrales bacterium]|nr:diguanylate cyclase [Candidatus Limnocylindrales bacterium]